MLNWKYYKEPFSTDRPPPPPPNQEVWVFLGFSWQTKESKKEYLEYAARLKKWGQEYKMTPEAIADAGWEKIRVYLEGL